MTVLFQPIAQSFNANTLAGSASVVRWTYTVPAGKRAILLLSTLTVAASAAAANTVGAFVQCTIGGTNIIIVRYINPAVLGALEYRGQETLVDLAAGDTAQGITTNNSAVGVVISIQAAFREYL